MKLVMFGLTIAGLFLLTNSPTRAEDNGLKTVDATGTLEEAAGFQLKMKDKTGKVLTILVDPTSSTARYTGTADQKVLSPGTMIRFTGNFDAKGNSQAEIKELEIFRPKVGMRMMQDELASQTPGVYPVEDKQNAAAKVAENKEAAAGNTGAKNSATNQGSKDNKSAKGSSKKTPANKPNDPKGSTAKSDAAKLTSVQSFKVVGQITNIQGNKIQVNTGAKALIVQLATNPKISVSMPDTELGLKGDKIHVMGLSNSAQPDSVQAKIVTITGAKPIAPKELEKSQPANSKVTDSKKDSKKDSKSDAKGGNNSSGKK